MMLMFSSHSPIGGQWRFAEKRLIFQQGAPEAVPAAEPPQNEIPDRSSESEAAGEKPEDAAQRSVNVRREEAKTKSAALHVQMEGAQKRVDELRAQQKDHPDLGDAQAAVTELRQQYLDAAYDLNAPHATVRNEIDRRIKEAELILKQSTDPMEKIGAALQMLMAQLEKFTRASELNTKLHTVPETGTQPAEGGTKAKEATSGDPKAIVSPADEVVLLEKTSIAPKREERDARKKELGNLRGSLSVAEAAIPRNEEMVKTLREQVDAKTKQVEQLEAELRTAQKRKEDLNAENARRERLGNELDHALFHFSKEDFVKMTVVNGSAITLELTDTAKRNVKTEKIPALRKQVEAAIPGTVGIAPAPDYTITVRDIKPEFWNEDIAKVAKTMEREMAKSQI